MPVQFRSPLQSVQKLFFVKCPPNRLVYMLDSPEDFHTLTLHWVPETGGSRPCVGDECPHCGCTETRDYTYTGCLMFGIKTGRWYQAILPVGDPKHVLATTNFKELVIEVGRPRHADDMKRMCVYKQGVEPPVPLPTLARSFDVRPFLLRRWGLYAEAELVGCQLHVPTEEEVAADAAERERRERAG